MRYSYRIHTLHKRRSLHLFSIILVMLLLALIFLFRVSNLDILSFLFGFLLSLVKISFSYFFALLIASFFTFLVLVNKNSEKIFLPMLDALQSFPSFAFLPLLVALLGKSLISVLIVLTIEMVWPILFSLLASYKGIRQDLFEAATIFGARGPRRLFAFTIPALKPGIVTGSIVAWGEAWETVIGAEIILKSRGLGEYFSTLGGGSGSIDLMIVAVVGLMILLFILNKLLWLPILERVTRYQTE